MFLQKSIPPKAEREKPPCKTPQGGLSGSLQKGLKPHPKYEVGIFLDAPCWLWPWGIPGLLPHLSGDGHLCWPHGLWSPWGSGGVDWAKGPLSCSLCSEGFPKGHPVFLGGASHQITQDHRTKEDPFLWSPLPASWTVLLSVVQKSALLFCTTDRRTVVNDLWMSHYCLGHICSQCLKYITTSANTMHHHLQLCKQI